MDSIAPAARFSTVSAAQPASTTVALSRPEPASLNMGPPAPKPAATPNPGQLQTQIDQALAGAQTNLSFRVDSEANRVVVSVMDQQGEVLMQIPSDAALAYARRVADGGPLVKASA